MTTIPHAVERMEAAWAAEYVTRDGDVVTGVPRPDAIQACQVAAWDAAKLIPPGEHPIDPFITAEMERKLALYKPLPGQWWTDTDRVQKARTAATVERALRMVRAGFSPRVAGKEGCHEIGRELPVHCREDAELRVYHLCRLAGLLPG